MDDMDEVGYEILDLMRNVLDNIRGNRSQSKVSWTACPCGFHLHDDRDFLQCLRYLQTGCLSEWAADDTRIHYFAQAPTLKGVFNLRHLLSH